MTEAHISEGAACEHSLLDNDPRPCTRPATPRIQGTMQAVLCDKHAPLLSKPLPRYADES